MFFISYPIICPITMIEILEESLRHYKMMNLPKSSIYGALQGIFERLRDTKKHRSGCLRLRQKLNDCLKPGLFRAFCISAIVVLPRLPKPFVPEQENMLNSGLASGNYRWNIFRNGVESNQIYLLFRRL
jgi:hypothetical protein